LDSLFGWLGLEVGRRSLGDRWLRLVPGGDHHGIGVEAESWGRGTVMAGFGARRFRPG
jgi:hypothetical protein